MSKLETEKPSLHATLENYTIRTVVLIDWNSEDLLLSLFLRLNTGSLTLSPQELRQALIPGHFLRWLDVASGKLEALLGLLGNRHPDRRMVDAELLLRFLAFSGSPLQYNGNLKQFLDQTCRAFNRSWESSEPELKDSATELGHALDAAKEIFGERGASRKWSGDKYERAVNRAVFDIQAFSLSIPRIRAAALLQPVEVANAYKRLCDNSRAFSDAISATTKTSNSFRTRHRLWQEALNEVLGMTYELPISLVPAE